MTREEEIQAESHRTLNKESIPDNNYIAFEKGFCIGAKWADQHPREGLWDSEKVIEWLKEYTDDYFVRDTDDSWLREDDFIRDLRKAMEEQQ